SATPLGPMLARRAALRSSGILQTIGTAYLTREAGMADRTAAPTGGRALFVRQSSGLVREVSVRNALFYNTAAFIGITVAWAPVLASSGGRTAGLPRGGRSPAGPG